MRAAVELGERDERGPPPEVARDEDVEQAVIDLRLRSDVHPAAEVRAVRGDDDEMFPLDRLIVDHETHRLRPVRRDRDEGPDEIPERGTDDARARLDPFGDVAVDAHTRGVHEDPTVHLADVDDTSARIREKSTDVASLAWIPERTREVVARPDRIEGERGVRANEAVGDLVRGAVATDGNDGADAVG